MVKLTIQIDGIISENSIIEWNQFRVEISMVWKANWMQKILSVDDEEQEVEKLSNVNGLNVDIFGNTSNLHTHIHT